MEGTVEAEPARATSAAVERERVFRELVATQRDRVIRLAWRLTGGDHAAAEDVAQDAFLKAHRSLGRFRGESTLATWLYRIVVHQARDYQRWRAVRQLWTSAPLPDDAPDPASPPTGDPALRRRIAQALDKLTARQREAFVLVHLEGLTVRECSYVLGKPLGTVKSHLQRALVHLRSELADLWEESHDH